MASYTNKKTCAKCNKTGGTAMCYGCEQAFCTKHFIEHQQELSQQMDSIGQEHDILQGELKQEQHAHPLLNRINQWEYDSIKNIQEVAKTARIDLHEILSRTRNNLKTSLNQMTEEFQLNQQSDDYTELDIQKWIEQLQKFRNIFNRPVNVNIDFENNDCSIIRLIKITDQPISRNLKTSSHERFIEIFEKISLSEDGLVATCLGNYDDWSCVGGMERYSSGIHYIRFRIEQLGKSCYTFIGITNSSTKLTKDIWESTSLYGWFEFDYSIEAGVERRRSDNRIIRTGDELTFVLNCDNQHIKLKHHRLSRIEDISVDLQQCPFPWKIVIVLLDTNDCIKILR